MIEAGKNENQARWQRMEEIYHAALPLTSPERHAFVAQRCAGDAALQEEINTLLKSDDLMADFLQEPVAEVGLAIMVDENLWDTEPMPYPTQSTSIDLVGTKIAGRYEVIERLGGGGFGDVYKAADTKVLSRPVAIKVLKIDALNEGIESTWKRKKFKQEMEVLAKVDDPGIVRILDADALPDGRPYIVMEFVDGTDLRHFIKESRQDRITEQVLLFQDVAQIVKLAGCTLTVAHEAGVFHRDLKPENIMLRRNASGDLQVKIIDFGIAKVRNSIVAPSTSAGLFVAGTWQYMSPEQLHGKKVDAASDIYTLGVIAYEILTGRYPFPAKDPAQLKEMQEAGVKVKPCDLNPDLPLAAQAAILRTLKFYPAERYKRARDFGDELASALSSVEVLAPQHNPVPKPWLSQYNVWIYTISILLLAGISFAAWRSYRITQSQQPQPQQTAAAPITGPERTLTYWLSIQRPGDKEPKDSTGNGAYYAGSKYWFNVHTTQAGALYLFTQGHEGDKTGGFHTLFPTPVNGKGDARIAANTTGRVNEKETYYDFEKGEGTIYLWIIWADKPVPQLDEIAKASYNAKGIIPDPQPMLDFIKQHSEPKPEVTEDDLRYRVTMKGQSEILVGMRRLEYHP
jgi:serine/threonine protein kinase